MKKKLGLLALVLLIIGGCFMAFSLNKVHQEHKEAERNRKYEVSLVKALKNSYRDLEEIEITNPIYYDYPGNWACTVQLTFSDGEKIEYALDHGLGDKRNNGAIAHPDILHKLDLYFGTTKTKVKVIFSDGKEEVR